MKYNDNGTYKDIYAKAFDTLPVGTEVDYDGETVPDGWSEIADPNTYSSTEVRIGTWLDGKPLYRKILTVPTLSNNDNTFVVYDSTFDIKTFDVYVSEGTTSGFEFKLPVASNTLENIIAAYIDISNHQIGIRTFKDRTTFTNNYAIIEYTKTTD